MSFYREFPILQECALAAAEIIRYAMECNNTETEQEVTGSKPTFFVEFSGHIAALFVRVYPFGYEDNSDCVTLLDSGAWKFGNNERYRKKLEEVLAEMHRIFETWEATQKETYEQAINRNASR